MSDKLIFFVDDDKMIINLMEYTFKNRDNYDIRTFFSGEECLDNLHLNPDLIVLDHYFTRQKGAILTGLETLKKIREKNVTVPVIMLTSQGDQSLLPEFIKYGALKYIAKDDYFIDTLLDTITAEMNDEPGKQSVNPA
ncbi:MAG: response regulator [Bacteroidota bacterium]